MGNTQTNKDDYILPDGDWLKMEVQRHIRVATDDQKTRMMNYKICMNRKCEGKNPNDKIRCLCDNTFILKDKEQHDLTCNHIRDYYRLFDDWEKRFS